MEHAEETFMRRHDDDFTLEHGQRNLAVVSGRGRGHDLLEYGERRALVTHDGDFAIRQVFLRGRAQAGIHLLFQRDAQAAR